MRIVFLLAITCGLTRPSLAQHPEITAITSAVNPYQPMRYYAYGDVITVFGLNLAARTTMGHLADAPTVVDGVQLKWIPFINDCAEYLKPDSAIDPVKLAQCGIPLGLAFVSPNQINAVIPWSGDPKGGLIAEGYGDYAGCLMLVKDGKAEIYLARVTPDPSAIWNVYPFDVRVGARPSLVIWGFTKPFTTVGQKQNATLIKDSEHTVPYAALTGDPVRNWPNYAYVTSENPVQSGDTITIWVTGSGDLNACGSLLCLDQAKVNAILPTISFTYNGKRYRFPTTVTFAGSAKDMPWVQQLNSEVSVCTTGISKSQPLVVDARIGFNWSNPDHATGDNNQLGSLPLQLTGKTENGLKGSVYVGQNPFDPSYSVWTSGQCLPLQ